MLEGRSRTLAAIVLALGLASCTKPSVSESPTPHSMVSPSPSEGHAFGLRDILEKNYPELLNESSTVNSQIKVENTSINFLFYGTPSRFDKKAAEQMLSFFQGLGNQGISFQDEQFTGKNERFNIVYSPVTNWDAIMVDNKNISPPRRLLNVQDERFNYIVEGYTNTNSGLLGLNVAWAPNDDNGIGIVNDDPDRSVSLNAWFAMQSCMSSLTVALTSNPNAIVPDANAVACMSYGRAIVAKALGISTSEFINKISTSATYGQYTLIPISADEYDNLPKLSLPIKPKN